MLAVSRATALAPRAEPLSPRASRVTPRCKSSSRPPGPRTGTLVLASLCQRPLTRTCPLTVPPPIPRSIGDNRIGDEGASALAAILNETMISELECAATLARITFPLAHANAHARCPPLSPHLRDAYAAHDTTAWTTRPNRSSETPRAAASALPSSKRPRCATPPPGVPTPDSPATPDFIAHDDYALSHRLACVRDQRLSHRAQPSLAAPCRD